jgi:hypothetical protein
MPEGFNPTFMLRIAAHCERRQGGPFTLHQFAASARSLGQAQGYVDSAIPDASRAEPLLEQMCLDRMLEKDGRRYRLTARAHEIIFEMSDEHTEDVESLLEFLADG